MIVFSAPDYSHSNPYQLLLAQALAGHGVETKSYKHLARRRLFPLFSWIYPSKRGRCVLHLHWIEWFTPSPSPLRRALQGGFLAFDVLLVSLLGCRVVWTIHNIEAHDTSTTRVSRAIGILAGFLAREVIVHNHATKKEAMVRLRIAERKISVIPQGDYRRVHEPYGDRSKARAELGLPASKRVFLFIGMIRPYKGLEELLPAWRSAVTANPDAASFLVIAGSPGDEAYASMLRRLANGLEASVRLDLRWIDNAELPLYLAAADVAVFPYRKISNSASVVLAMSHGVPVLAPDTEVLGEMLGAAGGLLYSSGEEALAHALMHAMTVDLAELRSLTATACEGLDWERVARDTLVVYRRAA